MTRDPSVSSEPSCRIPASTRSSRPTIAAVAASLPLMLLACAEAPASLRWRGHARSGDAVAIGSYVGKGPELDRALADFAASYADQNEKDHATLLAAVGEGKLEAVRDA